MCLGACWGRMRRAWLPLALVLLAPCLAAPTLAQGDSLAGAEGAVFVRWSAALDEVDKEGVESTRVSFEPGTRRLTSLLLVNAENETVTNVSLRVEPRGLPLNVTLGGVQPEGDRPRAEVQRWDIVLPNTTVMVGMSIVIPDEPGADFELAALVEYTLGEDGERRETITLLPGRVAGEARSPLPGPAALAVLAALGAAALAWRASGKGR